VAIDNLSGYMSLIGSNYMVTVAASFVALSLPTWAAPPSVDAFAACMKHTQNDRDNCQSGCGMILQSCYDEGVEDVNKKIDSLLVKINVDSSSACFELAKKYSDGVLKIEDNAAATQPGWIGAELKLKSARQRLAMVDFFKNTCR
jgi:hypothetical protein